MRKLLCLIIAVCLSLDSLSAIPSFAEKDTAQQGVVRKVGEDPNTGDPIIARWVVTDFGAVPNDGNDDSAAFKEALTRAAAAGGGTVFAPAGEYKITQRLVLTPGVTLRGVWNDPEGTASGEQTVLLADFPGSSESSTAFITLQSTSSIRDLVIYYPQQKAESPVEYPYTLSSSAAHVSFQNLTLINSYNGIRIQGSAMLARGIYGTFIHRGITADLSYEVSSLQKLRFSGSYWEKFDHKAKNIRDAVRDCRLVSIGKEDDFMVYDMQADTAYYENTVWLMQNRSLGGATTGQVSYGMLMHGNGAVLNASEIDGNLAGRFVNLADFGRAEDYYRVNFMSDAYPEGDALEIVTEEPYGAAGDGVADDTAAIAAAIESAESKGGGIVYLPAGRYRVTGSFNVPTGVQIRGDWDAPLLQSPTQIEVYGGRGNEEGALFVMEQGSFLHGLTFYYPEQILTPDTVDLDAAIAPYPYVVQGKGSDIRVEYISFINAYNGMDFYTHRCDNLTVRGIWGTTAGTAMKIGGGSENGRIEQFFNSMGTWYEYIGHNQRMFSWFGSNQMGLIFGDIKNFSLFSTTMYGAMTGIRFEDEGEGGARNIQIMRLMLDLPYSFEAITLKAGDDISIIYLSMGIMTNGKKFINAEDSFEGTMRVYHQVTFGYAINMLRDKDIEIYEPEDSAEMTYIVHNLPFGEPEGLPGGWIAGICIAAALLAGGAALCLLLRKKTLARRAAEPEKQPREGGQ